MEWIIALLVGAFVGWIASIIMQTDEQQSSIANILIGVVGGVLAKWLFSDLLGIGAAATTGQLTLWGIVWGIVGAVILIGVLRAVNVLR